MILLIKCCFGFMLLVMTAAGIAILRNWEKLFGLHPDLKNEGSGAATLSKTQFIIVWILAIKVLFFMIVLH